MDTIELQDGARTLWFAVDEIVWVEAAGNYVEIHTRRSSQLIRHTIKAIEARLGAREFVRVRPSAVVNCAHVRSVARRAGGEYWIELRGGERIASSRSYRAGIEQAFGLQPRRRGAAAPSSYSAA